MKYFRYLLPAIGVVCVGLLIGWWIGSRDSKPVAPIQVAQRQVRVEPVASQTPTTTQTQTAAVTPAPAAAEAPFSYSIQVCIYESESQAQNLVSDFAGNGLSAFYDSTQTRKGKTIYRVHVGEFETAAQARTGLSNLKNSGKISDFPDAFVKRVTS